jgi:hypothetical protein
LITKEKLKTLKILSVSLLLAIFLASCNLPGSTATNGKKPMGTFVALTSQVQSTQTEKAVTPFHTMPVTASPMSTLGPPDTPVWSVYNYTCEPATGGSTMTMSLVWIDRSDGEESYKVYRDKQLIAILPPNSTAYVDTAFVAMGKTISYSIEAFNNNWQASTSTITHGCQ